MTSLACLKRRALACALLAGLFLAQGAEGAIIVKSRTDASPTDTSEDKAARPDERQPAELAINVSLPFVKISQLLNQFEFRFQSQGTAAGFVSYKGTLTVGKVSVASSGQTQFPLRVVAPFKLVGTLAGQPVDLNGEASINVALDVGADWCPILKFDEASVNFSDKAAVPAKVDKSIPSLTEFVASKFLTNELQNSLTCDIIKKEIAKAWGPVTLPVTAAGKKLFLKFDPQSLAVSQFAVAADRVSFSLSLGARAAVVAKVPPPKKVSLPGVKSIAQRPVNGSSTEAEATLSLPISLELR